MDEADEETDEAHDSEANRGRSGDLDELYRFRINKVTMVSKNKRRRESVSRCIKCLKRGEGGQCEDSWDPLSGERLGSGIGTGVTC